MTVFFLARRERTRPPRIHVSPLAGSAEPACAGLQGVWAHTLRALALLTLALLLHSPVQAQETNVNPGSAQEVLEFLQDDAKRAALEQALAALADPEHPNALASPPPPPIGLIKQTLASLHQHLERALQEWRFTHQTFSESRIVLGWLTERLSDPERRTPFLISCLALLLALGLGLAMERWLLRRLRPRLVLLEAAAAKQYARDQADANHDLNRQHAYWRLLRRLPYTFAYPLLRLTPLLGLLGVVMVMTLLLGGRHASFVPPLISLVEAYLLVRLTLAGIQVLISPKHPGLRLLDVTEGAARHLYLMVRRLVFLALFGMALADILMWTGVSENMHNALSKIVSLAVYLLLIINIWTHRHAVSARVQDWGDPHSNWALMRHILADIWAYAAIISIALLWIVWALGVVNGFAQFMQILWRSALVILLTIALVILALGSLDRLFYGQNPAPEQDAWPVYHRWAKRLVLLVLLAAGGVLLLASWGLPISTWFATGTLARNVLSAVITVALAALLAMFIWELSHQAVKKKINAWSQTGDHQRAARLTTLLPLLRAALIVVLLLVVAMTALSQLGINIAPLLAGASIVGVALGFGSQKLVQDFITGVFLLMEDAMQVGDAVTLAGVTGTVENLSIRTVRLRSGDGALHVVPFSSVGTVTNTNKGVGNVNFTVRVRGDSDIQQVSQVIHEVGQAMRQDPIIGPVLRKDLVLHGIDQLDGASLSFVGQLATSDRSRSAVARDFNRRILEAFRLNRIALANPQERMVSEDTDPMAAL